MKFPKGLGYSINDYSEPGCEGILIGGKTFSLELGTNYSAPNNDSDDPDVNPDTQPYQLKASCENDILTTTLMAKHENSVFVEKMMSYRASACYTSLGDIGGGAYSGFNPSRSTKLYCDKLSKDEDGQNQKERRYSDSGGQLVGIIISVMVFLLAATAGYFIYKKRNYPLPKPASASQMADQNEDTQTDSSVNVNNHEKVNIELRNYGGNVEDINSLSDISYVNPLSKLFNRQNDAEMDDNNNDNNNIDNGKPSGSV